MILASNIPKTPCLTHERSTEKKNRVTPEWEEKLYIGIALNWDYEKGTVQLSIPGYLRIALYAFQHKKSKRLQDSPYP